MWEGVGWAGGRVGGGWFPTLWLWLYSVEAVEGGGKEWWGGGGPCGGSGGGGGGGVGGI